MAVWLGLLLLVRGALAADPATPGRMLDMAEATKLALLNNAQFLSAQQDTVIALERVRQSEYLFLPEIGLEANVTKYDSRYPFSPTAAGNAVMLFPNNFIPGINNGNLYSGLAYMSMTLYEGGRTLNTLHITQAAYQQALIRREAVRMDTVSLVKQGFYRLLLAQESEAAHRDYLTQIEGLFRGASFDSWRKIQSEAVLSAARAEAAESEHELSQSRLSFLKSLNLELDTPFQIAGDLKPGAFSLDLDKAVLWAIELRPELQSETYKAQMDAIAVSLAAARRTPTVFLGGDYGVTNDEFPLRQNNWDATLGIKIPFSYDYWSQLTQKKAEQRQGEIRRAELQDQVRLEVRQAYEDLRFWQKEWPQRQDHYQSLLALYNDARRSGGAGQALEQARALKDILEQKLALLDAITKDLLARARLERAMGKELEP